ncbi:Os01g0945400, partial [Oryza sativa Japonica Group]
MNSTLALSVATAGIKATSTKTPSKRRTIDSKLAEPREALDREAVDSAVDDEHGAVDGEHDVVGGHVATAVGSTGAEQDDHLDQLRQREVHARGSGPLCHQEIHIADPRSKGSPVVAGELGTPVVEATGGRVGGADLGHGQGHAAVEGGHDEPPERHGHRPAVAEPRAVRRRHTGHHGDDGEGEGELLLTRGRASALACSRAAAAEFYLDRHRRPDRRARPPRRSERAP